METGFQSPGSYFLLAEQKLSQFQGMPFVHLASDFTAALFCFVIALLLMSFVRRREDLRYRGLFFALGAFLIFSGLYHTVSLMVPPEMSYGWHGMIKVFLSFFAVCAALGLWKILPRALELPGPEEFEILREDFEEDSRLKERQLSEERKGRAETQEQLEDVLTRHRETLKGLEELGENVRAEREKGQHQQSVFNKLSRNPYSLTLLLNHDGRVLQLGGDVQRLLGYDKSQVEGRDAFDFLHPEDSFKARKLFAAGLAAPEWKKEFEFRFRRQGDGYRIFRGSGVNALKDPALNGIVLSFYDVTELRQIEHKIDHLPLLMRDMSEAADFHQALEKTLKGLCLAAGWDYAEAWIPRPDGRFLECCPLWAGRDEFKEVRAVSEELRIPPKVSLQGRVWSLGRSFWIEDINERPDTTFFREDILQKAGVKTAFGVPVFANGKTEAVLVFFKIGRLSKQPARNLVLSATVHLGSVFQRKISDEQKRLAYEGIEKKIQERTQELIQANEDLQSDLTEHLLIEESLRQSEENAQTLINSLDGIVWEFDLKEARYTFVSQRAELILGYPMSAWLSDPLFWRDHVHGSDREQASGFRKRAAEGKQSDRCEYRMITADGRMLWFRDMVTVVEEDGAAVKLRGVMVNITESKHVEEALYQERNFVSTVLDTASALVMILDVEGKLERFNRACLSLSGYEMNEVRGKCFWDLFVLPEEKDGLKSVFARLMAGQFPTNYESSFISKKGDRYEVAWTSTVLFKKDGAAAHIIVTGIDITQRKEVERKLKETVADLARSNQDLDRYSSDLAEANTRLKTMDAVKSHFISAASHELRTPLTSIKGFVETILQNEAGPINGQQQEFLTYVKESTDRLHRLLNELLDISKIEAGQVTMKLEQTSLREILTEEIAIFRGMANKKEIQIELETDLHLMEVACDSDMIREVIGNLLSNAIKYTPRNGRVKVLARNVDRGISISVEDNGVGISQEDQARIFEPFQHIQKEGFEDEESTGLGLTLVKRIVEAHGGFVDVKSEPSQGSAFRFFLPLGKVGSGNGSRARVSHE